MKPSESKHKVIQPQGGGFCKTAVLATWIGIDRADRMGRNSWKKVEITLFLVGGGYDAQLMGFGGFTLGVWCGILLSATVSLMV